MLEAAVGEFRRGRAVVTVVSRDAPSADFCASGVNPKYWEWIVMFGF